MGDYVWIVITVGITLLFYRHGWEKVRPPEIMYSSAPSDEVRREHERIKWSELFAGGGRSIMAAVISLAVLSAALYIILSRAFTDSEHKWAFGIIGTLLGYWLKA
jgi:hypothetical protein